MRWAAILAALVGCALPPTADSPVDAAAPEDAPTDISVDAIDAPIDAPGPATYELVYKASDGIRLGNLQRQSRLLTNLGANASYGNPSLSPDGASLAYAIFGGPGWNLVVRPLLGSDAEARVLTAGDAVGLPAWSPDGTRLAYLADAPGLTPGDTPLDVRIVDIASGAQLATHRIPDGNPVLAEMFAPQWSPDGTEVAFSDDHDILSLVVATGEVRVLTSGASTSKRRIEPRWSPDGAWVAYTAVPLWLSGDGEAFIERVSRAGGTPVVLTRVGGRILPAQVRWSPNGERLAYVDLVQAPGLENQRFLSGINREGGDVIRYDNLTAGGEAGHPEWSPDGRYLLYTQFEGSAVLEAIHASGGAPLGLGLRAGGIEASAQWLPQPVTL